MWKLEENQFLGFGGCGTSPQRAQEFGRVTETKKMVKKSSMKNMPGGRASKNGAAMVANKQLNKECSQLSGRVTQARKMVREATKKNRPKGSLQLTQELGKATLIKQRVGGALKNNAPGGRTSKNGAAKVVKKYSTKSKAGGSHTKSGGNVAKKHARKGGMDLNTNKRMKNEGKVSSEKAEETERKVVVKPGKTERKSEGGLCAVKREKKSRSSESGLSRGFLAKQKLVRKGKRESPNKYSSPLTIGKKRKVTSPDDLNCAPTSPGKPYHGRTWLPVGEGEVQTISPSNSQNISQQVRVRWIATQHGMESAWCEDWKRLSTSTRERRHLWRFGTGTTSSALGSSVF